MAAQPLRLGLRVAQLVLSFIALVIIAASFKGVTGIVSDLEELELVKVTVSAGSPATTFGMLMTYTAMLYGLWNVVAVEIYAYAPRQSPLVDRYVDGFFALVLLIAGIVLATADYVKHCDLINSINDVIRCGSLKAGVAFTFVAMASYLVTFGLNFLGASHAGTTTTNVEVASEYTAEAEYHGGSTPKDALSPIGGATKTPEAHV